MKRLSAIVLLACAFTLAAHSQALPSLLIPTDGRSLAMGGVRTARVPAGLDFNAYYSLWAPASARSNVFGADISAMVMPGLSLTADIKRFSDRPYESATDAGSMGESFKPYDFSFSVGAEYCLWNSLLAGFNVRNTNSSLAKDITGSAVSGDIYAGWISSGWSVMLAARNIGTKINFGYGEYALPALIALSGDWKPLQGLSVAAEADYLFAGAFMAGVGAEYGFRDIAFLRAGYHYGSPADALPSFVSLGLGGKYAGVRLDASVLLLSPTLGGSFIVSLGYGF